jgi:hypothetical protein
MIKSQASTLINSTSDRVFKFIAVDFCRNYQRWSPEVIHLEPKSEGPVGIGTTCRQVRIDKGRRTESTFRVSSFEPGKRVDFQGTSNPFRASYQLDSFTDKTRLTFTFELHRLDLYMRPFEKLIRLALQEGAVRVVRNIKDLIEVENSQVFTN